MKKLLLATAIIIGSLTAIKSDAQVRVSIHANIGNQPLWGPAGYDYAEFYYLPDVNMYYDVDHAMFIYFDRGKWIYTRTLPAWCRNFDLFGSYKVVVNEYMPFLHNNLHRAEYARYKNMRGRQVVIYKSNDVRYVNIKKNKRDFDDRDRGYFDRDKDFQNHDRDHYNNHNDRDDFDRDGHR